MKHLSFTIVATFLGFQALASTPSQTTRTTATGREQVLRLTVGRCSVPAPFPFSHRISVANIQSNVDYKVCREYSTTDYEVSGSFWNRSYKEIEGSTKISYKLEERSKGSSQFLTGDLNDGGVHPVDYGQAVLNVLANCSNLRDLLLQQQVDLQNTPCNQQ